jgi:metal-responsive CopG/Arc/MetJ family transcriptional regulator
MKTAISIPDSLNDSIKTFLKQSKMSRSEFFQRAAKLYLDKYAARAITANLDRIYAAAESPDDSAFRKAAILHFREIARDDEW